MGCMDVMLKQNWNNQDVINIDVAISPAISMGYALGSNDSLEDMAGRVRQRFKMPTRFTQSDPDSVRDTANAADG